MTNPQMLQALADGYRRDRLADAAKARLLAVATCCRPSAMARAAAILRARVLRAVATRRTVCCA